MRADKGGDGGVEHGKAGGVPLREQAVTFVRSVEEYWLVICGLLSPYVLWSHFDDCCGFVVTRVCLIVSRPMISRSFQCFWYA
jgi:hypothetical protein